MQTESFTGRDGCVPHQVGDESRARIAEGAFLLTIHSAISGRPLQVAVDQRGPGADTAYINEDPRVFFAVVDAENIEWSFSVDEAIGTSGRASVNQRQAQLSARAVSPCAQ